MFSVSDTRVLVYQSEGHEDVSDLIWYDSEVREVGRLGEPADYQTVAISPDGSKVAVAIWVPDANGADLWIYDVERGIRTRFTFDAADDDDPVWSPDSSQIVFSSAREGAYDLYVKSVGGVEDERLLLSTDKDKVPTDWSSDGRHIIFMVDGDVWALPTSEGEEPFPVVENDFFNMNGRLSPDGRWIAYSSFESGQAETYVTSFPKPGRKWQASKNGGYFNTWRADGKEIFYGWRDSLHGVEIDAAGSSIRIGADRVVGEIKGVTAGDITRDGERSLLAITVGAKDVVPITLVVNWTEGL